MSETQCFIDPMDPTKEATEVSTTKVQTNYADFLVLNTNNYAIEGFPDCKGSQTKKTIQKNDPKSKTTHLTTWDHLPVSWDRFNLRLLRSVRKLMAILEDRCDPHEWMEKRKRRLKSQEQVWEIWLI